MLHHTTVKPLSHQRSVFICGKAEDISFGVAKIIRTHNPFLRSILIGTELLCGKSRKHAKYMHTDVLVHRPHKKYKDQSIYTCLKCIQVSVAVAADEAEEGLSSTGRPPEILLKLDIWLNVVQPASDCCQITNEPSMLMCTSTLFSFD